MIECKIGKGWAIAAAISVLIFIGVFGILGIMPWVQDEINLILGLLVTPFSIGIIIFLVYGLINIKKRRFIIDNEKLISISVFKTKELYYDEIKGYKVNERWILIIPKDNKKKKIKVDRSMSGTQEALSWISEKFDDLDMVSKINDEEEILNNENIGWTREIREEKLLNARKTTKVLNILGIISFVWTVFFPIPYIYAILSTLTIPISAVLVTKFFSGLIRLDERKDSAHPTVVYALTLPSLGLSIRSLLDFEIFDYSNVWIISVAIMVTLLSVILIKQEEFSLKNKKSLLSIIPIAMFLWAYGFGATIFINCYLDTSRPELFTAKIVDKSISNGKITTYYLKLTSWGPQKEVDEVSVDQAMYDRVEVDNNVDIYFMNGKLEIPWFIVLEKQ
ncbi:MAG: hypothetical protein N4A37_12185 [Prolixibacteraceae bacterium]|jgi:hypothetical protein|nr:hypothetical protein [Prolixibacteraceae bacterium]